VYSSRAALACAVAIATAAAVRLSGQAPPKPWVEYEGVRQVLDYARRLPPSPEPRFVFMKPRLFTLETGIKAMGLFATATPDLTLREFERHGITHVVLGDLGMLPYDLRFIQRAVDSHPDRFALDYETPDFRVYRFLPPG
jgi:hypothetical protein